MNKLTKVFLGAGAFLVMSGGLLALSGWAMGGETRIDTRWGSVGLGGFYSGGGASMEESGGGWVEDLALAPFSALDVDMDLGDVLVMTGEDYGVSLDWNGRGYSMSYEVTDGTLRVRGTGHSVGFDLGSFNHYGGSATIYVPEGVRLEDADFSLGMGGLTVEDLYVQSLYVDCDMGDIDLIGVRAEQVDLQESMGVINGSGLTFTTSASVNNDMGDIYLEGDLRGTLDIDDSMGDITILLSGAEADYGYDMDVDLGKIYINGREYRDSASRSGGRHTLEIDNDMGDISVGFGG